MNPENRGGEPAPESRFSREEIREAKEGFECMARRLDELWIRNEPLTPEEEEEVSLILNNAMVMQEMMEGKTPEEFEETEEKRDEAA